MQEIDNILRILKETKKGINEGNAYKIKNLSDQTIHSATLYEDADNIVVAVLVYSISKIIERESYRELSGWKEFYSSLIKNLDLAILSLEQSNIEKFRKAEQNIRISISKIDGKLRDYIEDIFRKARINKASKIYEHGLSLTSTSELLGTDLWELAAYVGQSSTGENSESEEVKKRIKFAEELFK